MKNIKILLVFVMSLGSYCVFARQFDITLDPNANFMTKQNQPAMENQRMDISGGMFMNGQAPSYRHITHDIIKAFNLNIRAKDLEITYIDANTGNIGFLKDAIKKKLPKKRKLFFDTMQDVDGVVVLNVTKLGMTQNMMPIISE